MNLHLTMQVTSVNRSGAQLEFGESSLSGSVLFDSSNPCNNGIKLFSSWDVDLISSNVYEAKLVDKSSFIYSGDSINGEAYYTDSYYIITSLESLAHNKISIALEPYKCPNELRGLCSIIKTFVLSSELMQDIAIGDIVMLTVSKVE